MALSLYVNTIQVVLRADPADNYSWSRIYGSLCCLRQSLLCSACHKLLSIPNRPAFARCEHNYCRRCIGGRKPQCEWCNDNPEFEESARLRVILQCYKKMCRYIMSSAIIRCWDRAKLTSPMLRFISMISEGAGIRDRYHYPNNSANGPLKKKKRLNSWSSSENENSSSINGHRTIYTVHLNDSKLPKVMIKKASIADSLLADYTIPDASSDDSEIDCPKVIAECLRSVKKRKSCRCGMATQTPGKLTCCGQRCPCYINGRACINCRCRGCRNPQKNLISSPPYHSNHPNHDIPHKIYDEVSHKIYVRNDSSSDETSYSDSEKEPSE